MNDRPGNAEVIKYLGKGNHCPRCGSTNIGANDHPEVDGTTVVQSVDCYACSWWWQDIYVLKGISYPDPDDDTKMVEVMP